MSEQMIPRADRNLAMELVRATEAAAIAAARYMGMGKKDAGDQAAVDAMRTFLKTVEMRGTVIIGEGEKDQAPMLFNGEQVGNGEGPEVDVAVDPVEGTTLLAEGRPNSITSIAVADKGSMWDPGNSFYMNKIVVEAEAKNAIDITKSPSSTLYTISEALGRNLVDLTVFFLDKPRHMSPIEEIRRTAARITRPPDVDGICARTGAVP